MLGGIGYIPLAPGTIFTLDLVELYGGGSVQKVLGCHMDRLTAHQGIQNSSISSFMIRGQNFE